MMNQPALDVLIRSALEEDIGTGDATTLSTVPASLQIQSVIIAKQSGTLCGLPVAQRVLELCASHYGSVHVETYKHDGEQVSHGDVLLSMEGSAHTQLVAERTMLNFMGRMSGIATITRHYVDAIQGTDARILDTRKTAPGLRLLDKYAVVCGGGMNHRIGLFDMILIKDNHIDAVGSITKAVQSARLSYPEINIEVECRTLQDVQETLDISVQFAVQRMMLDNMSLEMMRSAVTMVEKRIPLEASGNVSLATVRAIAETGVDFISVGAITHSAPCFDLSMKYTA